MEIIKTTHIATLKQIAEEAGVSIDTVSRVLNGKNKEVWASTAARAENIRLIAQRLNYSPNVLARSTRTGKFGCIALLQATENSRSILSVSLLQGIQDAVHAANVQLTLTKLPDDKLINEGAAPKILREWLADGLLINYQADIPQRMIDLIDSSDFPYIWINSKHPSNCVYPDDFEASRTATEHLLAMGHKRIAYAEYVYSHAPEVWPSHYSAAERLNGYNVAMHNAGLTPQLLSLKRPLAEDEALQYSRQVLSEPHRPTAILAYCAHETTALLYAMAMERLRVGEDISLMTFGQGLDEISGATTTRMEIQWGEIGRVGTQMLLEKIASPEKQIPSRGIKLRLRAGATCRPPVN